MQPLPSTAQVNALNAYRAPGTTATGSKPSLTRVTGPVRRR